MASEFDGEIAVIREDVQRELAELSAQLPAAIAAAAEAKEAHEAANYRFHNLELRVSRATGKSATMGAVIRLLNEERDRRDRAAGLMVKAQRHVANIEWSISSKHAELDQLDAVQNPAPIMHRYEVVKRPMPEVDDNYDTIQLPQRAA